MIEIFRQLKKQAMFIFALRRLNDFLRSNNPMCSTKGKQTGLKTTLTQSRIVSITIFFELFSPFCEIRHNKQNLQSQNLESLYAQLTY